MSYVAIHPDDITIIDFAAGVGMLGEAVTIALESVGFGAHVVVNIEREASAAAALVAALEPKKVYPAPVWDDVRTFDGRRYRGLIDCVVAGYPCQPFSFAGKRGGESDPRHLWPAIREQVEAIEPSIVFLENVSGHLNLGSDTVVGELEGLGFRVTAGLFSSEEVGASHGRERLFILGVAVADPKRARRQGDQSALSQYTGPTSQCDGEMADTEPTGCGQMEQSAARSSQAEEPLRGSTQLPRYAPPRNDWWRWRSVAELDPTYMPAIESEVRRMADGLVPWADRLRLIGNGVDPLAAAYAFITLWACLMITEDQYEL